MVNLTRKFDVLVIGGGNARCVPPSAPGGPRVGAVLEGAPKFYRGGQHPPYAQYALRPRRRNRHSHRPYTEQEFGTTCCASPAAKPTKNSHGT